MRARTRMCMYVCVRTHMCVCVCVCVLKTIKAVSFSQNSFSISKRTKKVVLTHLSKMFRKLKAMSADDLKESGRAIIKRMRQNHDLVTDEGIVIHILSS